MWYVAWGGPSGPGRAMEGCGAGNRRLGPVFMCDEGILGIGRCNPLALVTELPNSSKNCPPGGKWPSRPEES